MWTCASIMPGRTVNRGKSYVVVSAAPLPTLTMREPSTATTALRSTPPLPSRTVPALIVTACCAPAGAVMPKRPASPASAAATGAVTIDGMRIGPPPWIIAMNCRVGKGALRHTTLLARTVVRLCPRCPILQFDGVGKVARGRCAMSSTEAGDFAHPTMPSGGAPSRRQTSLVFIAGIGAKHFFPAGKHRLDDLAAARTILHRMNGHRDRVARFYRIGTHTHGDQPPRRAQFNRPQHRLAGLLVIDHDAKPRVRIDPFEFLHRPLQRDGLLGIEHGEGVMRNGRRRESSRHEGGQGDEFQVHGRSPE